MNAEIDTSNLKILEDFFDDLSTVDQRKIFLSAFRKASIPIVEAAKGTVPVGKGNLWRSIGTKTPSGETSMWVGSILNTPYINPKGKLSKVWYGLLTEGGAQNVGRIGRKATTMIGGKKSTRYDSGKGGYIIARHWFADALAMSYGTSIDLIQKEWYEAIERFISRANAKMK